MRGSKNMNDIITNVLALVVAYLVIILMYVQLDVISISYVKNKKRQVAIAISAITTVTLLIYLAIRWHNGIFVLLLITAAVECSLLYSMHQEKSGKIKVFSFFIPANEYITEEKLIRDVAVDSGGYRTRSQTELVWNNKLIIMTQPFYSDGEALNIDCIKPNIAKSPRIKVGTDTHKYNEIYMCKRVTKVKDQTKKGFTVRGLLVAGLIVGSLAMPLCIYLAMYETVNKEYWVSISTAISMYMIFGFIQLVIYGKTTSWKVRLLKIVCNIFIGFGLLQFILTIAGVYK